MQKNLRQLGRHNSHVLSAFVCWDNWSADNYCLCEYYTVAWCEASGVDKCDLNNATVTGKIYIKAYPKVKKYCDLEFIRVSKVKFFVDGHLHDSRERIKYYCDGNRDNYGYSIPLDSHDLHDGHHELVILFLDDDWQILEVITVKFYVKNEGPSRRGIRYSEKSDRSNSKPLSGAKLERNTNYFIFWAGDAESVTFWLDGTRIRKELSQPYDLAGTAENGKANPWNFRASDDSGKHTLKAIIQECWDDEHCSHNENKDTRNTVPTKECCQWLKDEACFTVKDGYYH